MSFSFFSRVCGISTYNAFKAQDAAIDIKHFQSIQAIVNSSCIHTTKSFLTDQDMILLPCKTLCIFIALCNANGVYLT